MITISHLTKRFGRVRAVSDLSLSVAPGQALALWGANGAGKTTLIRCMLGVLRYRGRIEIGGIDARRRGKAARRLLGYVPQELAFYDEMRVGQALAFFGSLKRVDCRRAAEWAGRVGLADHLGKRCRELSGGMKQRLALAMAMLADPPLIVLDEPTSNLDAAARAEVVASLVDFKRAGKTILFASHRAEEVETLADRVAVVRDGRLLRDCLAADLGDVIQRRASLRLFVQEDSMDRAIDLLNMEGLDARRNGHGLIVQVGARRKGAPFDVLLRARIPVRDFEILSDSTGGH